MHETQHCGNTNDKRIYISHGSPSDCVEAEIVRRFLILDFFLDLFVLRAQGHVLYIDARANGDVSYSIRRKGGRRLEDLHSFLLHFGVHARSVCRNARRAVAGSQNLQLRDRGDGGPVPRRRAFCIFGISPNNGAKGNVFHDAESLM